VQGGERFARVLLASGRVDKYNKDLKPYFYDKMLSSKFALALGIHQT